MPVLLIIVGGLIVYLNYESDVPDFEVEEKPGDDIPSEDISSPIIPAESTPADPTPPEMPTPLLA